MKEPLQTAWSTGFKFKLFGSHMSGLSKFDHAIGHCRYRLCDVWHFTR